MTERRLGVIMNGVTGRMGMNQQLARSVMAIRQEGGVHLADGTRVIPDPILVGRNAETCRDRILDPHGPLAAGEDCVDAKRCVIGTDRGARLHVGGRDALIAEHLGNHQMRRRKCGLRGGLIPERSVDCKIVDDLVVQQRRSWLKRRESVGDGRQRVIMNDDAFRRIVRGGLCVGDHHGDRLADKSHALPGKRLMRRLERRLPLRPGESLHLHVVGAGRIGHMTDAPTARGLLG